MTGENAPGGMRMSRRALVGGSAAGMLLLPSIVRAQARSGLIRAYAAPRQLKQVDHAIVYRREDEFCGWPHTSGFWDLGNGELLQNFMAIPTVYESAGAISHDRIGTGRQGKMVTVRSKDYGRSWDGAKPTVDLYGRLARGTATARTLADLGPVDYLDRNVLVANGSTAFGTPEGRSSVRVSRDRGRSWSPAFPVPLDGLHSLSAINSVLVRPDGTVLIWLIEVDKEGWNRRPLLYALPPGGTEFHFLSFLTPKQDPYGAADGEWKSTYRFGGHRWFYPRGLLLPNGRMLGVLRCQRDPTGVMWTEVHCSDDGGRTWGFLSRVNDFGAPGSLVRLPDGRLVMVYGQRLMPSGIRATVSTDEGKSWGPELIVRDDGGSWDLGYPNAWVTDDGRIGVLYYFNSRNDRIQVNGGVRHIARSIFSVD
jgi:hypothetical protein